MSNTLTKRIFIEFATFFIPVGLLLVLGTVVIDQIRHDTTLQDAMSLESALVRQESEVLSTLLASHISDTVFLAQVVAYHLNQYPSDEAAVVHLAPILRAAAQQRQTYHQVRYLNAEGHEVVRINFVGGLARVVTGAGLQDKSSRDYFKRALPLPSGRVYISRFDLNIEQGKVEVPHRPTLRLASPVFDVTGRRRGIVVLNFLGERLLGGLRNAEAISRGRILLANTEGYWMLGPGPDQEWGFVLPGRAAHTMAKKFPEAWPKLADTAKGQLRTSAGLFTFESLAAKDLGGAHSGALRGVDSDEVLRIVSWVPAKELIPPGRSWVFIGGVALLAATALFFWFWGRARVRNAMAEQELRESEETMAAIGESVQDAIIMVGPGDQVEFWNPAAVRMFGYTMEEMAGKSMHELLAGPEDASQAKEGMKEFDRSGRGPLLGTVRELTGRRKDGSNVPLELALSSVRLRGRWLGVASIRDITERKRYEAELRRLATTDPLTGLANRRHFMDLAEQVLHQAQRYGHTLSVIMLDVDHFKSVNDTYGHAAGDEVLKALARVGSEALREVDVFGRLGGEEFAVLLPDTGVQGAHEAAERLRIAFAGSVVSTDEGDVSFTVSLGVAALAPDTPGVEGLLNQADVALYEAKESGRDRVVVFEPKS